MHPLRPLGLLVALVCTVGLLAPVPAPAVGSVLDPTPGAPGIGDSYFPLDGNGGIDVLHYDVRVAYDLASGRLQGSTRVTLRATRDLSGFNLDLLLPVQSVQVDDVPAAFRKPDQHELQITPAAPLRQGETVAVTVAYDGLPAPITYAGEQNWLADDHEVVAMNQPHMAPWWFPANDHPRDRARFDVHVTVPTDLDVVGNGTLVGRTVDGALATTHWRSEEPMATYLAFFAAGRFRTASGVRKGLPWYVAVSERLPPAQQYRAMQLMRRTPAITSWLERRLGRYPFSSTGGLTTSMPVGFALENQTRPTYPVMDHNATRTVVHEIAHQWFGDSVTVRGWRDIWLNEGPATYFEVLWTARHGGPSGREWLAQAYRDLAPNEYFWRIRVDDPGPGHLFDVPVYQRGAMALQALRSRIGRRDFDRLLRTWVRSHRGRTGTTRQFVALAERVSGEDLGRFFQAWLRAPRPPAPTAANGL
ncbi:M1 family metallopeptidase [Nocardioides sp. W7]|uniref:M1 family metallopeptidase n=1 Tax=Nocardioides sp. W7 TaxID=2931390 RepID=UPI001FD3900A|nr:M1 family metallopeptidase [Nocardioides sp. W7]